MPLSFVWCYQRKAYRAFRGRKPVSVLGLLTFCSVAEIQDVLRDLGLRPVLRGARFIAVQI